MRRCSTTASPPAMRRSRNAAASEAPAPSSTGDPLALSADLHGHVVSAPTRYQGDLRQEGEPHVINRA